MNRKVKIYFLVVTLLTLGLLPVRLSMGEVSLTPFETLQTLLGMGSSKSEIVLFQFRLPRLVLGILIGMGLAVSGAILQGVSRNPLADPGIIGINAGASLVVVAYLYLSQGGLVVSGLGPTYALPFFAFLGAAVTAFVIYIIALKNGKVSPTRLILVGIGVSAGIGALLIILQMKMNPRAFSEAIIWLSGSIWGASWPMVMSVLPWILVLIPYAAYKARYLNLLNMGEAIAIGLGTKVEKERRILLIVAVALAGACVAVGGNIAFLGLLAPHLARHVVGPSYKTLIPASAITGAALVMAADLVAKNLLYPGEIPVGITLAAIGSPYFIYLLMKTR
ncbi:FecCD family ABC transporter permease [Marinococcus luteus]|uniref:FecCD family ABC transporter permease n=1 Tax=Marinococcus luteus TaxID=1122204 RepID=UPI002ACC4875|nr:iron ABC transporter permease [Marinococcus luteus]MDZ5783133.1 iron ABC transporter permease [Marinococcus luteus]